MTKKKVLFLIMVYDNPIIMEEYKTLLAHYSEMKEKHHLDNFEFYGYTSGQEDGYDAENKLFTFNIGMPECMYATYIKTQKMFEYADKNLEFDYIYRSNTSTFCNVALLDEFIQNTKIDDKTICGAEMYCRNSISNTGFTVYYKYIRGNSVLIPRNLLQKIYENDNHIIEEVIKQNGNIKLTADDDIIGYIFKDDNIIRKSFFQEWLGCFRYTKHIFGNNNRDPNYLFNFIAIQIRSYEDRSKEIENLKYLCKIFFKYKYKKQHLWNVYSYYNGRNVLWLHPNFGYIAETADNQYFIIGFEKEKIINFIKGKS